MGKEGIEKIFKRFPERKKKLILDEALIKLEAQNAIYTTDKTLTLIPILINLKA